MVRQIILAGFVVFLPVGVQAQRRGMMPPVSRAVVVAPRVVVRAAHPGTALALPGTRAVMRRGAARPITVAPTVRSTRPLVTPLRRIEEEIELRPDCSPAPGLGFDEVHLAAVCGSGRVALLRRGLQVPFFFPFFDGGFFLPGSQAAEAAAAMAAQTEAAEAEARETNRRHRVTEPVTTPVTAPAAETGSAAPTENEQFVFVRRDGTVFFAVAYTWDKETLRYITSQGLRRTVTQDALDVEATRRFNEDRGWSF